MPLAPADHVVRSSSSIFSSNHSGLLFAFKHNPAGHCCSCLHGVQVWTCCKSKSTTWPDPLPTCWAACAEGSEQWRLAHRVPVCSLYVHTLQKHVTKQWTSVPSGAQHQVVFEIHGS